jgi:endonuclease III related protein
MAMYHKLRHTYGPQHWWPGETAFEVIVGAILTQNTAWRNVEKAIVQLKRAHLLTPHELRRISEKRLASLIRPSGYFNIKAKRLKGFISFLFREYRGSLKEMFKEPLETLREKLLSVKGIGPETADSILLYAGGFPTFVVDAYTHRVFSRHRLVPDDAGYEPLKRFFTSHLPQDAALFNEYHALLVKVGKERCRKEPLCNGCPLEEFLPGSHRGIYKD